MFRGEFERPVPDESAAPRDRAVSPVVGVVSVVGVVLLIAIVLLLDRRPGGLDDRRRRDE